MTSYQQPLVISAEDFLERHRNGTLGLSIDLTTMSKETASSKGARWCALLLDGQSFLVAATGVRSSANVLPAREEEAARMNREAEAQHGEKAWKISARGKDRAPELTIQKYSVQPELEDDRLTVKSLPDDDKKCALFEVVSIIDKFFTETIEAYLEDNSIAGPRAKNFPDGCVVASNDKVCSCIQWRISHRNRDPSKRNRELPNPMARLRLRIDKNTDSGPCQFKGVSFFDGSKGYLTEDGVQRYEPLLASDGSALNNDNIHQVLKAGAMCDVLVKFDRVCFSNLGISYEHSVLVCTITPRAEKESTDPLALLYGGSSSKKQAAPPASGKPAPAEEEEADDEGDGDDAVDELDEMLS